MCNKTLAALESEFERMYAAKRQPEHAVGTAPDAWILMCLNGVRSCRRFTEELPFKLPNKWFVGMNPDVEGFDASYFVKNLGRMRT